jgi:Domain of unknown function (DUF4340)
MKVKKEYAILAVVIVALGLYLFFRNTDRTTYTLPELPAVKTQDLTKIEIGKGDQTVVLTRKDDGWMVAPGDYPADGTLVDRMRDALADLKVTALVSETQNYTRYELDENQQIRVTAYQDDKAVRSFNIGKAAGTLRHTHITLSKDPNVYHARGNFRQDFDQSVDSLRDKAILAFKKDAITDFSITTADKTVTVKKTDIALPPKSDNAAAETAPENATAVEWKTDEGQTVANDAVQRLLGALSGLKCRAYLTDQAKTDYTDPTFLIRINGSAESILEIFDPEEESATEVPARSTLRNDPFTLSDFDIDPVKDFLSDLDGTADQPQP